MKSRTLCTFLILVLLCTLLSASALAEGEGRTLRVGWFRHPGGQEYTDGRPSGYNYDYLIELSKYNGWKYEFVDANVADCLEMLKNGEIDLLGGVMYSDERTQVYDFPALEEGHTYVTLFTRQESPLRASDFDAYDGMTVALLGKETPINYLAQFAQENGFSYTAKEYPDTASFIAAVKSGEVDAGVMGAYTPVEEMRVLSEFAPQSYYFATTKGNAEILVELNRAQNQLRTNSPYLESELYKKYFGSTRSLTLTGAEKELVEASEKSPVIVGMIPSSAPICYYDDKTNSFGGYFVEMLNAITEKTGLQMQLLKLEMEDNTPMGHLKAGDAQLVVGILKTENFENDREIILSDALLSDSIVAVGRQGDDFTRDGETKVIAIPVGFQVAMEYAAEQFPQHRILACPDTEACLDAVVQDKADAVLYMQSSLTYLLQNPHYETLEIVPAYARDVDSCSAVRSADGAVLMGVINKGLGMITSDERSDMVMTYSIMNPYQLSTGELLYKYRLPLAIIVFLFLVVIGALTALYAIKHRSEVKLKKAYAQEQSALEQEKAALAAAETASAAKGSFMSRMSHEIRTPLNAVIGYNTIARSGLENGGASQAETDELVLDCLQKSDIASKHLLTIINDVLDMSAIESGRIQVESARFDLKRLITTLTAIFQAQAQTKGITLEVVQGAMPESWFVGDQMRINQIITNLLSNAMKFTPEGGRVTLAYRQLSADKKSARLQFAVKDTGIGMEKSYLSHIWTPFEQADSSISRRFGGTGLGLSITKNLVELMGGTIGVQSAPGKGSVFSVELVLARTKQEPEGRGGTAYSKAHEHYDFSGKRVLMAEDNAMNMEVARRLLESTGLKVDEAWNGKQALDKFSASAPKTYDLILMDIQMPVMDGHTAVRTLRCLSHPDAKTIPIIAMTADAFAENVKEALASGMNDHIAKPVDFSALCETIGKYLLK